MTAPAPRRKSCKQPQGAPCVAAGKRGACRLCTDFTKVAAAVRANWQDPEFRERQAAAVRDAHERRMAWCPAHLRDDYAILRAAMGTAEARRVIERQMVDEQQANHPDSIPQSD